MEDFGESVLNDDNWEDFNRNKEIIQLQFVLNVLVKGYETKCKFICEVVYKNMC